MGYNLFERRGTKLNEENFETVLSNFKKSGVKITNQRKLILKYLMKSRSHPTAKKIYLDLNKEDHNISLATVYNTLDALIKANLVIDIEDKKTSERHFDYFGSPHYHVICDICGKIVDGHNYDFIPLLKIAKKESNYLIKDAHAEVHGICPSCQKRQN